MTKIKSETKLDDDEYELLNITNKNVITHT